MAPSPSAPETVASTLRRYDDTSKYHPHDVQILKHFPDQQLSSLYRRIEYRRLYHLAGTWDECGIPPPMVPWPAPPPRAPEELEPGVEAWRTAALQAIDARIALYARPHLPATTHQPRINSNNEPCRLTSPEHQALRIPEILEAILRHATPSAQYTAWHISVRWRTMAEHILRPMSSLHAPVEHGQDIDQRHAWLQPSAEELARFEQEVTTHLQAHHSYLFFSAFLTQARELSQSTYAAARTVLQGRYEEFATYLPELKRPQWFDLSQFTINPSFLDLFPGRLQLKAGRCEIALRPEFYGYPAYQTQLPACVFQGLVGEMFLTEPPCTTLGIYHITTDYVDLRCLTRVHNDEGVRINDILSALQRHEGETMDTWKDQATELRRKLATADWTVFTFDYEKSRLWLTPGYPKVVLLLEPSREPVATLARKALFFSEDPKELFRREWFQNVERDWDLKTSSTN